MIERRPGRCRVCWERMRGIYRGRGRHHGEHPEHYYTLCCGADRGEWPQWTAAPVVDAPPVEES